MGILSRFSWVRSGFRDMVGSALASCNERMGDDEEEKRSDCQARQRPRSEVVRERGNDREEMVGDEGEGGSVADSKGVERKRKHLAARIYRPDRVSHTGRTMGPPGNDALLCLARCVTAPAPVSFTILGRVGLVSGMARPSAPTCPRQLVPDVPLCGSPAPPRNSHASTPGLFRRRPTRLAQTTGRPCGKHRRSLVRETSLPVSLHSPAKGPRQRTHRFCVRH